MYPEPSKDIVYLGKTNFRGREKVFGIRTNDRFQHMYVIGQTGTGKSTLLKNIVLQDIMAGRGMAVIDPHGEFVEEVLASIPEHRLADVIYFDPVDTEYPIGFNILETKEPEFKHLISSGLMSVFTKIWANVWSARMEYILNNTVLAVIDTPGATLLSIPRMLVDKSYRQVVVSNCQDPVVKSFWVNEFEQYEPKFRTEAIAPIQNKVGQFLSTHIIRNIVGQSKSTLDIPGIMNEGKILLVNVSKGRVGEDNSALLGAMLITKIQLSAMERVRVDASKRKDFFLFIDEFQNFATDSFASILSEARKYRLGMIISHQYIGQLITEQTGERLKDAVFGNVGTTITFRVSANDAEYLEKHYAPYLLPEDMIGLPNHYIYIKMMIGGKSSDPFSAITLPPFNTHITAARTQLIVDNSRKNYALRRADVEEQIALWASSKTGELKEVKRHTEAPVAKSQVEATRVQEKYPLDLKALGIEIEEEILKPKVAPKAPEVFVPVPAQAAAPKTEVAGPHVEPAKGSEWYQVDQAPKRPSKNQNKKRFAQNNPPQNYGGRDNRDNRDNRPPRPRPPVPPGPNNNLRDAINKALGL